MLDRLDERTERLGLALGDPGRRLVEQHQARVEREQRSELDDPPGAGGELADEAVGVTAESEVRDDLLGLVPLPALCERRGR